MATAPGEVEQKKSAPTAASRLWRLVTWLIAIGCFYLVYGRIAAAAARDGLAPAAII